MSFENTTVYLYNNIPFSINGGDIRYFSTLSDQNNYFNSRIVKRFDNLTVVSPEQGTVMLSGSKLEILKSTYISFINKSHENIMYYGFITEVTYVADNTYRVDFTIDNFQTYMTEYSITGEVEREHANYNELNTLPEDLGVGDYVVDTSKTLALTKSHRFAIVTTTTFLDDAVGFKGGTSTIDPFGVSQPYNYYVLNADNDRAVLGTNILDLMSLGELNTIHATDPEISNKIVSVQIVDTLPFPHTLTYQETGENTGRYQITSPHITSVSGGALGVGNVGKITNQTSFNANHILNKYGTTQYSGDSSKLNHYPFKVVELSNGDKTAQFKPELITGTNIQINEKRSVEINSQVAFSVTNYANEMNYLNALIYDQGMKMPVVVESLSAYIQSRDNAYLNPMLQIGAGLITSAVGVGMAMTGVGGVPGASVASTGLNIAGQGAMGMVDATIGQYKQTEKAKRQPNSITGSMDKIITKILNVQMVVMVKTQTPEYMKIGQDFFNRYGWKVLRNKVPNIKTRQSFNYVKMTKIIVKGNIPQSAKTTIENQFREGVTLWHVDDIGNYSQNNALR